MASGTLTPTQPPRRINREVRLTDKKAILVTGTPRSGTTWAGRVLASAPQTSYVLEPLNLARAEFFDLPVSHWYERISDRSSPRFGKVFERIINGREIGRGAPISSNPIAALKQIVCRVRDSLVAKRATHVILKDPIAILSADWFAAEFETDVVVTIRHPAAVVSSLRLQGWSPDFDDLFHQPEVIEKFFPDVHTWLQKNPIQPGEDETLYKAAVLWRLLHRVILNYRENFPAWTFVRHEDLSRAPRDEFRRIFRRLDLPMTNSTESFLSETTSSDSNQYAKSAAPTNNVVRRTDTIHDVWKQRLQPAEINRIRQLTSGVSEHFYDDEDW